jgi:hypothetical protein
VRTVIVLVAASLLALPGVAGAQAKFKTVKSTGVIQGHWAQPPSDAGFSFAGFVSDTKAGEGAITVQGTIDPTDLSSTGTYVGYFDKGTQRGSFALQGTPDAAGGFTLTGTLRIKGGTGAYKGAKGTARTTATLDADGYGSFDYTKTLKVRR